MITAGVQQIEDKTPIHIADMRAMIEEFLEDNIRQLFVMTMMTLRYKYSCEVVLKCSEKDCSGDRLN